MPNKFFGRPSECLDKNCPFLHDRDAILADGNRILRKRRQTLNYKYHLTYLQSHLSYASILKTIASDDEALQAEIRDSGDLEKHVLCK
jgi:hypothetical protein